MCVCVCERWRMAWEARERRDQGVREGKRENERERERDGRVECVHRHSYTAPCACACTANMPSQCLAWCGLFVDGHRVRRRQIGLHPEAGLAVGGQVRQHNHQRTRHRRNSHTVSGLVNRCRRARGVASVVCACVWVGHLQSITRALLTCVRPPLFCHWPPQRWPCDF